MRLDTRLVMMLATQEIINMNHYYNIYAANTYYFFGTVAVEQDNTSQTPPCVRAVARAQNVLNAPADSLVAIMSTQEQFWKHGI